MLVLLMVPMMLPGGQRAVRAVDDEDVYAGVYVLGFEASEFYSGLRCPENIPWWLDAAPGSDFFERLRVLNADDEAGTYQVRAYRIRFRGTLSPPGTYGHLGLYPRQVTVEQLLDAEPAPYCLPRDTG